MKFALGLILTWSAYATAAPVTLLDCNTSFGPDQGVQVKQDGNKITLIENTTHGDLIPRELTQAEWTSGVIRLRDEFGYKTTLTVEKGGAWIHATDGAKYNESGPADCQ